MWSDPVSFNVGAVQAPTNVKAHQPDTKQTFSAPTLAQLTFTKPKDDASATSDTDSNTAVANFAVDGTGAYRVQMGTQTSDGSYTWSDAATSLASTMTPTPTPALVSTMGASYTASAAADADATGAYIMGRYGSRQLEVVIPYDMTGYQRTSGASKDTPTVKKV